MWPLELMRRFCGFRSLVRTEWREVKTQDRPVEDAVLVAVADAIQ
jgi:hypothetical protein